MGHSVLTGLRTTLMTSRVHFHTAPSACRRHCP